MMSRPALAAAAMVGLVAGCATNPRDFARAPELSPIGATLGAPPAVVPVRIERLAAETRHQGFSSWSEAGADLFRDARAMRVGDVITVKISIKDKANIDNSSNRSRESGMSLAQSMAYGLRTDHYAAKGDGSLDGSSKSDSSSSGKGAITRSESIDLQVAAVVTHVLPNGHLVINGTQEVRVNFEVRELTVAGIVRPRDVSTENIVSYERIAEARISYGGRGRITEVQQPPWGQQLLDALMPF